MHIEYATLEQMLSRLFEIYDTQLAALRGRFRYIASSGVLQRTKIGRGRARYELEDILRVVLIFELEEHGFPPGLATRIVRNHWDELVDALPEIWWEVGEYEAGRGPAEPRVWGVVPHMLREMGITEDDATLTEEAKEFAPEDMVRWPKAEYVLRANRSVTAVHLHLVLAACCAALATISPELEARFRDALARFNPATRQSQID